MILVSEMRIFAGVPRGGASTDSCRQLFWLFFGCYFFGNFREMPAIIIARCHCPRPCNRFPMLRRVRNCRSYYYYCKIRYVSKFSVASSDSACDSTD